VSLVRASQDVAAKHNDLVIQQFPTPQAMFYVPKIVNLFFSDYLSDVNEFQ